MKDDTLKPIKTQTPENTLMGVPRVELIKTLNTERVKPSMGSTAIGLSCNVTIKENKTSKKTTSNKLKECLRTTLDFRIFAKDNLGGEA